VHDLMVDVTYDGGIEWIFCRNNARLLHGSFMLLLEV